MAAPAWMEGVEGDRDIKPNRRDDHHLATLPQSWTRYLPNLAKDVCLEMVAPELALAAVAEGVGEFNQIDVCEEQSGVDIGGAT